VGVIAVGQVCKLEFSCEFFQKHLSARVSISGPLPKFFYKLGCENGLLELVYHVFGERLWLKSSGYK